MPRVGMGKATKREKGRGRQPWERGQGGGLRAVGPSEFSRVGSRDGDIRGGGCGNGAECGGRMVMDLLGFAILKVVDRGWPYVSISLSSQDGSKLGAVMEVYTGPIEMPAEQIYTCVMKL